MTEIAVIGHGKTPEGKGWGSKIDNCDFVVRMWDYEWQSLIDYGERYDYGYFELSPKQWDWFEKYNVRTPKIAWIAGVLKTFDWKRPKYPPTFLVHLGSWIEIGRELGGVGTTGRLKLTRGCAAACWAVERLIRGDQLVLVGFDNIFTRSALSPSEGFSEVYRNAPTTRSFKNYVGGGTKYHNHDYVAEGAILRYLTDGRGVELRHAQEIW